MKPEHSFVADRPAAAHSPALVRRAPDKADPLDTFARFGERFCAALPEALATLASGAEAQVTTGDVREGIMRELLSRNAGLCAHGLLSLPGCGTAMLVSVDAAAVFQLVDKAFGGEGKAPDPLPERFPMSAELVNVRIENIVAALIDSLAGNDTDAAGTLSPVRRGSDIAVLRPFAADCPLYQIAFEVAFPGCDAWMLRLTMTDAAITRLCAEPGEITPAQKATSREPADPGSRPFGDIPLRLRATLVDMRMPLSRLGTLKPGDILPVSVARSVPLAIDGTIMAHGVIGEVDDRIALQITQAFATKETSS